IGVHQDGLVHISQLADRFVKDPHEVVKTGDIVSVRVVDVDIKRKRIALSMRSDDAASADLSMPKASKNERAQKQRGPRQAPVANNAFADALAGWKKK